MKQFFSLLEVAQLLMLHPATVRRYVKCGRIQCHRVGVKILFTQNNIDNFVANCKESTVQVNSL